MKGYKIYKKIIEEYGEKSRLFVSGLGTGDAYLYGLFFEEYVKKYKNVVPVYGVWNNSGKKIAELFHIQNIAVFSTEEVKSILNLLMFDSKKMTKLECMHYHIFYRHMAILSFLEGLHDFNYFSMSEAVLEVDRGKTIRPKFDYDENFIQKLFDENHLIPHKTVLLAPYAKSVKDIPISFWNKLVKALTDLGIYICTNSSGEQEPPLENTKAIFVPFQNLVPFAEKAGAVVGLRSGFLDVVSTAHCIKISLNAEKNNRRSLVCHINDSFSLSAMYGQKNQYDWLYSYQKEDMLVKDIVCMLTSMSKRTDLA